MNLSYQTIRFRKIFMLLLSAVFLISFSASAVAAGRVEMEMIPSKPAVGDRVYIKIKCINVNGKPSEPASVPGMKYQYFTLSRASVSTQSDGHSSYTAQFQEFTATYRAEKEGSYSFGPITVGGVRSNVLKYTIGAGSKNSTSGPSVQPTNPYMPTHNPTLVKSGGNDLFLRAELSNTSPYEQEGVVYTVKLYTSYEGTQLLGSPSAPSFENCTSEHSTHIDHAMKKEIVNGKQYSTAIIDRYILFPTHSGKATIKGNTISFSVKQLLEYDDGSSHNIPIYQRGQVDAEVPTVSLDVKPIPASPDGLHVNGVGSFDVKSMIPKTKVTANQIFTVKYIVTGTGNLNYVSLPDMQSVLPRQIQFVKSESKVKSNITSESMTGSVEFTVSLLPSKDGTVELPALEFVFFNPGESKFYSVKSSGYTLEVGKNNVASEDSEKLTFRSKLQTVGKLSKTPHFIIRDFPFYLLYIFPVVFLLVALLVYRRHVRVSADIVGLRRKKAGKVARTRLKVSERFMRRGLKQEFYSETLKALWGYMAGKLSIPVSELSRNNVSEKLLAIGTSQELVDKVIDVIDQCELARYATGVTVDMKSVYSEACDVIDALEKVIPGGTQSAGEEKKKEL